MLKSELRYLANFVNNKVMFGRIGTLSPKEIQRVQKRKTETAHFKIKHCFSTLSHALFCAKK